MKHKVSLILLRLTRYSDRHDIALAFTRDNGPISFLVNAGRGRAAARARALLMPMCVVDAEYSITPGRSVGTISDISPLIVMHEIYANPLKSAIAMFTADLTAAIVREGTTDPLLWDFIAGSMKVLAALRPGRIANYPIVYVMSLADMLGISPDSGSYSRGRVLDMRDGIYRPTAPLHSDFISQDESRIVVAASRLSYSNMHHLKLSRDDRRRLLDGVLRYISIHHARVDNLRSLDVVRSLF